MQEWNLPLQKMNSLRSLPPLWITPIFHSPTFSTPFIGKNHPLDLQKTQNYNIPDRQTIDPPNHSPSWKNQWPCGSVFDFPGAKSNCDAR